MNSKQARWILKFHRPDRPRNTERRQLQQAIDVILGEETTKDDLISRSALNDKIEVLDNMYGSDFYWEVRKIIDNAPTVERPQGEWIEYNATGKKQYMCSECSMKEKNPKIARYCYWCGAKMEGGEEK